MPSSAGHSFIAYIDESGDEGFKFLHPNGTKGSSIWLVMSAAVFKVENEHIQVKHVDHARMELKRPSNMPLHFRDLRHEQRVAYVRRISRADFRAISIVIDKSEVQSRPLMTGKGMLYNYACRMLLERISRLAMSRYNDRTRPILGDGRAKLIFSKRTAFSTDEFRNYLQKLKDADAQMFPIYWDHIDIEAEAVPHEKLRGLQFADVVASSTYFAFERHRLGHTEPRYLSELDRVLYRGDGNRLMGCGLKLFPSTGIDNAKRGCGQLLHDLLTK